MAIRPEEKRAAEVFERWLSEHEAPGTRIAWKAVEPDPPDLCFSVEREGTSPERWAVEVTTLVQYVRFNGEERNIKDFYALLDRLCARLNDTAPEQAAKGYLIFGSGPFEASLVNKVEQRALRYIEAGRTEVEHLDLEEARLEALKSLNADPADPHIQTIVEEMAPSLARFSIQAMPGLGKVAWTGWLHASARTPDGESFVGEIQATLNHAVNRILKAKLPRLKALVDYDRKVLLILSDYFFAEPKRLREILGEKKLEVGDGDAILLVDGESRLSVVADPARLFQIAG